LDATQADEISDIEAMGLTVDGMTVEQIRKLWDYYAGLTKDVDLERIDYYVK